MNKTVEMAGDSWIYPGELHLKPVEGMVDLYRGYKPRLEDTGYDLFVDADYTVNPGEVKMIGFGVSAASLTGYLLIPRSSICKTPLMMANSVGLIDSGYRGPIMAPVRNIGSTEPYRVERGTRLFQLLPINEGKPFSKVRIVSELPSSERNEGGFGSTGKS